MASGRTHFVRWSDKNQHDGPKHFLLFLGLSFYPLIPRLMKNCTRCSSELSRFRGNNYQSGDLCFSRPDDKHPAPWGMVWKWYNFKRVKFHCFLHPLPPSPIPHPPPLLSLWAFYFAKVRAQFFCRWGQKKKKKREKRKETIKNIKGPSSQNIRHRETTQSHDEIYQNWQVKVDCWSSIDWAIFHWETQPRGALLCAIARRRVPVCGDGWC